MSKIASLALGSQCVLKYAVKAGAIASYFCRVASMDISTYSNKALLSVPASGGTSFSSIRLWRSAPRASIILRSRTLLCIAARQALDTVEMHSRIGRLGMTDLKIDSSSTGNTSHPLLYLISEERDACNRAVARSAHVTAIVDQASLCCT